MNTIRLFFVAILFVSVQTGIHGQVAINTSGNNADGSAMLDVSDTTRGFLAPRLTQTQRLLISSPATGLLVYQTDMSKGFYYYTGSSWERVTGDLWEDTGTSLNPFGINTNKLQVASDTANLYGFYCNMNTGPIWGYGASFSHTNSNFNGVGVYVKAKFTGSENNGYTKGLVVESESTTQDQIGIESSHYHTGSSGFLKGMTHMIHMSENNSNTIYGISLSSTRGATNGINYGLYSVADTGSNVYGVYGKASNGVNGYGLYGTAEGSTNNTGVYGSASGWGGHFSNTGGNYVKLGGASFALQIVDGNEGSGKMLYSDASGNAGWGIAPVIPTPGGVNRSIQFNKGGQFEGDSDLVWNDTTERMGIHIFSPANRLDIQGNINITSTDSALKFNDKRVLSIKGTDNTFLGVKAGDHISTGRDNVFIGMEAGDLVDTSSWSVYIGNHTGGYGGDNCTFVGYKAGRVNYNSNNTAVGMESGTNLWSGGDNVFVGYRSAYESEYGSCNTVIGAYAGADNQTSYNTLIGYYAGSFSDSGSRNVCIGPFTCYQNGNGSRNVTIGYAAGFMNDHNDNIFIGDSAGYNKYFAAPSICIGTSAGRHLSYYGNNVLIGYHCGYRLDEGYNVMIGDYAGKKSDEAKYNTVLGHAAGYNLGDGDENTFIGDFSGFNNSGSNNVMIGNESGHDNSLGSSNVYIGNQAGKSASGDNKLYIDNSSTLTPLIYGDFSSNRIGINVNNPTQDLDIAGNLRVRTIPVSTGTALYIDGTGTLCTMASDDRLKENLQAVDNITERLNKLQGYSFNWKSNPDGNRDYGFVAQEVNRIFPEMVYQNQNSGHYGINYDRFVVLLVEANKEQQKKIEDQDKRIEQLEKQHRQILEEIKLMRNH